MAVGCAWWSVDVNLEFGIASLLVVGWSRCHVAAAHVPLLMVNGYLCLVVSFVLFSLLLSLAGCDLPRFLFRCSFECLGEVIGDNEPYMYANNVVRTTTARFRLHVPVLVLNIAQYRPGYGSCSTRENISRSFRTTWLVCT